MAFKYLSPEGKEVEIFYYFGVNLDKALEFIGSKALVDTHKVIFIISKGELHHFCPNCYIMKQDGNFSVLSDSELINFKKVE